MFTKTTIVLLGLFVACEVCTLIVFYYQRTVRKLAMRLNIAQSKLVFCYPKWMLTMYKGTFLKFGIILALFIIEWRCALVSLGIFALFFFLSCVIIVPDGGNLIRIRREVKRCGSGTIGITTYQALMTEIEKGIVVTGGDLAKIDAEEQNKTEWGLPFKQQENLEWADGKTKVKDRIKPQETMVRTWENAPASIKGAIIVIGLVFGGMSLLVGVTVGEMTPLLALVLLLILSWLGFWIHQILKGRNWTRVFAIVLVLQCIVSVINNISKGGVFDLSSLVGGVFFALVIAALLFCPEANKWFVSWPQGWSYWPVLLVIAQIVTVLVNQSTLERSNENSKDESMASQGTRHKRRTKHANISYANAPIEKVLDDAQNGIIDAQVNLGLRYATGRRGVEKDQGKSFKWYFRAAVQGDALAQNAVGIMYQEGRGGTKNEFEAAKWFLKAAEQGNADAQNSIAEMYVCGSGVVKNYEEAIKWYRKAAEQGHVKAQEQLGLSYFAGGNGVEMDWIEAKKWARKAAEQGSAESQCVLGRLIELTGGNDKTEALKWYRKAAAQGHAAAQANLGYCYDRGEGVTKDEEEAIRWYRKAARQGYWSAQETLREKGLSW